ncbi:hypothetical protein Undi14_09805 [Undibacterium sp. 14-3-2]|uniref:hypothetical protein n=1 Tax=Undibacterium sp. 14-3-2 TaxID=2800129 RepID=UPI001908FAA9|nr:hypothetical protein [Undibacterium sp. 14-3-2]MBK1890336.1 hypothetical protein [Undibacterium sp. 14-3-2]
MSESSNSSVDKKLEYLRMSNQVCYTLIPPILMSIQRLAKEQGGTALLKEIRELFEMSLDNMLYQDVTKDEAHNIAQNLVSRLLSDD